VAGGPRYRAVLLDFRGILVHDPGGDWWIEESLRRVGRSASDVECAAMVASLETIPTLPGYADDERRVDTSLAANRKIMLHWLTSVGIDQELAEELWKLDCEPVAWPVFPDVAETVRAIRARGCSTALVSDFHVDLRPHLKAHGLELDAYVISFEHGFQKPDPRMFTTALDLLEVGPREALMVGDRASHDGGAAAVGIDTLILPAPSAFGPRGLDVVLGLLS
jgi:HAD superfamily hydrolase (TIGR01549 family)